MNRSRYIPFNQQPYCCVPASLQTVMYRRGIPLVAQETLGNALGLTVPETEASHFNRVRTGPKPPAGWGTRISEPEFEINKALSSLAIPLHIELHKELRSPEELSEKLNRIQQAQDDALVCFDYGVLWDKNVRGGHVCVVDWIAEDAVGLIDPLPDAPKFRQTTVEKLFRAIDLHGPDLSCGVWEVKAC